MHEGRGHCAPRGENPVKPPSLPKSDAGPGRGESSEDDFGTPPPSVGYEGGPQSREFRCPCGALKANVATKQSTFHPASLNTHLTGRGELRDFTETVPIEEPFRPANILYDHVRDGCFTTRLSARLLIAMMIEGPWRMLPRTTTDQIGEPW